MGMDIMDVFVKIGADTSALESGVGKVKGIASGLGGVIGTGMKAAGVAIGAATTAVAGFSKKAVEAGMDFDKSMSQVAATMGKTSSEMEHEVGTVDLAWGTFSGNLRDYAQEMGANTQFTASQAADALNYMALAGYNTQQSMEMLPNVLNLAAAGAMDLALASDMVTDTQSAFAIDAERTTQMVDEMAKAASTGNTNVQQLGEAFLVVGGLAQELNGGMVTLSDGTQQEIDGLQELEIALTAMANSGIKGSEAGTHMRNMIMKLSNPTKDGAAAMEEYGLNIYDAEGKMRSMKDIMVDLSDVLGTLSQEEKIGIISDLFNTRDLASAEALMGAFGDKTGLLATKLREASFDGEALAQAYGSFTGETYNADTAISELANSLTRMNTWGKTNDEMLSTLQNDFGMTAEQAQKAIDTLGAVDEVENDWDKIGEAITKASEQGVLYEGKLYSMSEAQEKFGDAINDTEKGFKVLGAAEFMALQQMDNLDGDLTYLESAFNGLQIAVSDKLTPSLRDLAKFGTTSLSDLTKSFKEGGLDSAMETLGEILSKGLTELTSNLPELINAGLKLLEAFGKGLIDNAPVLFTALIEIGGMLREKAIELFNNMSEALSEVDWAGTAQKVVEFITNAFNGDSTGGLLQAGMNVMLSLLQGMLEALPVLVEGLSGLATDLLTTLVEKTAEFDWAGTTQKIVDFIVQAFSGSSDGGFLQLGLQIITNIISGIFEALPVLLQGAAEILQMFAKTIAETAPTLIPQLVKMIGDLAQALTEPSTLVSIVQSAVEIVMALAQGILNAIPELLRQAPIILSNLVGAIIGALPTVISAGVQILNALITGILGMLPDLIALAPRLILALVGGLVQGIVTIVKTGKQLVDGFVTGIKNAWTGAIANIITFFTGLIDRVKALFGIHSPSKVFADIGKALIQGMIDGIKNMIGKLKDKAKDILDVFKELPKKVIDIGKNIIEGVWDGMNAATDWLKQKITGWVGNVMDFLKGLFGIHSPSTVTRDLIGINIGKGVAEGIEDSIPDVENALNDMTKIVEAPQIETVSTLGNNQFSNSASVLSAMENEQKDNRELTIILELDKTQLAKTVYQLNNDETQRVGVRLAGGFA